MPIETRRLRTDSAEVDSAATSGRAARKQSGQRTAELRNLKFDPGLANNGQLRSSCGQRAVPPLSVRDHTKTPRARKISSSDPDEHIKPIAHGESQK